jgi:hypothetical protein
MHMNGVKAASDDVRSRIEMKMHQDFVCVIDHR